MSENPNINHYDTILANWYDLLLDSDEGKDIEVYKEYILKYINSNILELACGTGRLLVPYKKLGAKIDGLDSSSKMLSICKDKLEKEKLYSELFEADMVNFNLNKKYDLIFISGGSIQLIYNENEIYKSLENIYNHLNTRGKFVFDIFPVLKNYNSSEDNVFKLSRIAKNKDTNEEFICLGATRDVDFKNQVKTEIYKYEIYKNKELIQSIIYEIKLKWYSKNEIMLLLEKVGFKNITVIENDIMSVHSDELMFEAEK